MSNHICVAADDPRQVYLATTKGIFKSSNCGDTWVQFHTFGLLDKQLRFVAILPNSHIMVAAQSDIFIYKNDKWQQLSRRLTLQDIRNVSYDSHYNIYAGGDSGLYRSRQAIIDSLMESSQEFTVQEIQQAAIRYAQVVDPKRILSHHRLSRIKAILPDLSLDYNKTIYGSASTKTNGSYGNIVTGPRDWSISFTWSLGDLIWSEQHRLIDSQTRLLVMLRQDILDEVTRLYFERKRLQSEYALSAQSSKMEKKLRIQQLTALLDGLTGGYITNTKLSK